MHWFPGTQGNPSSEPANDQLSSGTRSPALQFNVLVVKSCEITCVKRLCKRSQKHGVTSYVNPSELHKAF